MIYCVVPKAMESEGLYERLSAYYEDDPNVTVIVDRRESERRTPAAKAATGKRELRDRRRRRPGELPPLVSGE